MDTTIKIVIFVFLGLTGPISGMCNCHKRATELRDIQTEVPYIQACSACKRMVRSSHFIGADLFNDPWNIRPFCDVCACKIATGQTGAPCEFSRVAKNFADIVSTLRARKNRTSFEKWILLVNYDWHRKRIIKIARTDTLRRLLREGTILLASVLEIWSTNCYRETKYWVDFDDRFIDDRLNDAMELFEAKKNRFENEYNKRAPLEDDNPFMREIMGINIGLIGFS